MLMPSATRVLVFHPDPIFHRGLVSTLREDSRFEVMEQDHGDIGAPWDRAAPAHVVITDLRSGVGTAQQLREACTSRYAVMPAVLVISHSDGELSIRSALAHGVKGYMTQDCQPTQLIDAVLTLAHGQRYLQSSVVQRLADTVTQDIPTPREIDVLRLMATGLCNKAIASELNIGCGTVKTHVKALLDKLGAPTRTAAANIAKHRGLLDPVLEDLAGGTRAWPAGAIAPKRVASRHAAWR